MSQIAVYEGSEVPRAGWGRDEYGITLAKKTPRYVHGKIGQAALLHLVEAVELWWNETAGSGMMIRRKHPKMIARTLCGHSFFLEPGRAKTCDLPKPDAVLCGRCHGEGLNFPRGKEHKIPRPVANARLGCIAQGAEI